MSKQSGKGPVALSGIRLSMLRNTVSSSLRGACQSSHWGNGTVIHNMEAPMPAAQRGVNLEEHPGIKWYPPLNVATGRANQGRIDR